MTHVPYKGASPAITGVLGGEIAIYVSNIPPASPFLKSGRLKSPDVQARFAGEGGEVVANTPEDFAALIGREISKWTKVIKASGARVD